jgi:hypothetical protein
MELIESGLAGMELIENGLAGTEISIGGESSAKTRSRKKSIRKPKPYSLTPTRIPKADTCPPQTRKTEEQRGEVEEAAPPTEEQEVENYRKYWEMCFGCRYGSYDAESKKFST